MKKKQKKQGECGWVLFFFVMFFFVVFQVCCALPLRRPRKAGDAVGIPLYP